MTDQFCTKTDIKDISKHILFSVAEAYNNPNKAKDYRKRFSDSHRIAEDSGGFSFLMGKLPIEKCDPMKTVEIYRSIGVTRNDFPIQLDLPPKYILPREERAKLIIKSAEFYNVMKQHIDWVVPVVHGWTLQELLMSYTLLSEPEKIVAAGTNLGLADGCHNILDKVPPGGRKPLAVPNGDITTSVVDHVGNFRKVAVGSFNIDQASPLHFTGGKNPRIQGAKAIAVGAFQQSGINVCDCIAAKTIATPACSAEQIVQRTPQKVVWERLATVLNLFKNFELFMLGSASSHDFHILSMGGARYGDTSSWRIKAYLGEILIPEKGAVSLGYKATSPRMKDADKLILQECLRDSRHPFNGMSITTFMEVGKMNIKEYRETLQKHNCPIKPFDLRARHNAFVLKVKEEEIANLYANDPDKYHAYLQNKRFHNRPNLERKLKFIWERLKRPYVQSNIEVFLKGSSIT